MNHYTLYHVYSQNTLTVCHPFRATVTYQVSMCVTPSTPHIYYTVTVTHCVSYSSCRSQLKRMCPKGSHDNTPVHWLYLHIMLLRCGSTSFLHVYQIGPVSVRPYWPQTSVRGRGGGGQGRSMDHTTCGYSPGPTRNWEHGSLSLSTFGLYK